MSLMQAVVIVIQTVFICFTVVMCCFIWKQDGKK